MKKYLIALLSLALFAPAALAQQQSERTGPPQGRKPPKPEEVMKRMDTNGDQKISKQEAKGPLQKDFASADKNKDGFLTVAELKAFKPKRPPHGKGARPAPQQN